MRNIKKTLCLVLALVFVLGLCTVGAADVKLSDIDQVNKDYASAVKALIGLGIIEGKADGTFAPTETVTREQAAKFIAYICLGPDNAEIYPAKASFSDVTKDMRMSKYIAFCANNHIIDGYTDGTFQPKKAVKQSELCKMLLAAVGYGKNGEFTGRDWDSNVFETAVKTALFKNFKSVDFDAACTREQTALLAFNTLMRLDQVVLSKDTESYQPKIDASTGFAAGTYADTAWDLATATGIVYANKANGAASKSTELDTGLKVVTDKDSEAELLGHKVLVRYSTDVDTGISTAYYIEDQSTEVTYSADLATAVATANTAGGQKIWTDGVIATGTYPTTGATGSYVLDEKKAVIGYKMPATYFVATLDINATTGVMTAVEVVGGVDTTRTITNAPEGAKKGDIVTVQHLGGVYTASACSVEEKVMITQKDGTALKWNDGKYTVSAASSVKVSVGTTPLYQFDGTYDGTNALVPSATATYTMYLDSYGKVYAVLPYDASAGAVENDIYLVSAWQVTVPTTTNEYGETIPGSTTNKIQIVDAEGKVSVLNATADYSATAPTSDPIATLSIGTNGAATLTALSTTSTYAKQDFAAGGFNTYFKSVAYDFSKATWINLGKVNPALASNTGSNLKVTVDSNIDADAASGSFIFKEITMGTTKVKQVVAVWYDAVKTTTTSSDYIYVASGTKSETRIESGKSYDYYAAYKNGVAMKDFKVGYTGATPTTVTPGFYTGYTVAADGAYTLGTAVATVGGKVLQLNSTTNFILNGKLYIDQGTTAAASLDLANVVVIDTFNTTKKISTVAELEAAIKADGTKTYTIDFVMIGSTAKAIAGGMIILTTVA